MREKHRRHPHGGVTQILSHLRAVEDLEPLPLPEAEVILSPSLVVIKSHEQSHPCSKTMRYMLRLERADMNNMNEIFVVLVLLWGFLHLSNRWAACYRYKKKIEELLLSLFFLFLFPSAG